MAKDKKENNKKDMPAVFLSGDIKKSITAVLLIMVALIFILSLIGKAGVIGQHVDRLLAIALGWGRYGLPILMVVVGVVYFRRLDPIRYYLTSIGAGVLLFFLLTLFHLAFGLERMIDVAKEGSGGGYLGLAGAFVLTKYLGKAAGFVISIGGLLIGFILTFNFPLNNSLKWLRDVLMTLKTAILKIFKKTEGEEKPKKEKTEDNIKVDSIEFVEDPASQSVKKEASIEEGDRNDGVFVEEGQQTMLFNKSRKKRNNSDWAFSDTAILDTNGKKSNPKNLNKNAEIIKKTLHDFGIEVEVGGYNVGPTVVQYTFKPAIGVRLSKILSLQPNIALNLAASSVRVEAPIPGRSLVGVEVPLTDSEKALVRMRTVMESAVFKSKSSNLSIILGEDVSGDIILDRLERMPHLLIAGATNTGKSVCINSILISLLYQNSPDDLKFILIDPKRVELSPYNGIPHLLTPVITDTAKVVNSLKWAVSEMERRYRVMQEVVARDIYSYNEKADRGEKRKVLDEKNGKYIKEDLEKMPFIVIVIDELADIMMAHGREVEVIIARLAQMARAVGIHLIISTQRPSVNVLTGIIKANIGTRIAFQVATQVDSRTILDMAGAEKLLGNGDMLFTNAQSSKPKRIQGVFISEQEVKKVVNAITKVAKEVDYEEDEETKDSIDEYLGKTDLISASGGGGGGFSDGKDEILFEQAKNVVMETGKASTTFLQRKLGIGYPKAANIMEMLEEHGVVGPQEGPKARQVLMKGDASYDDPQEDQEKREEWEE